MLFYHATLHNFDSNNLSPRQDNLEMAQKDIGNKIPLHTLNSTNQVRQYYDDWVEDEKYDRDMVDWNYTGPAEAVRTMIKYVKSKEILIFDAGCGTGLVGKELNNAQYHNIDGADLSQKSLDQITGGIYRRLSRIDLNKRIPISDNFYDAVICVGTFTYGHLKPHVLDEFLRITKKNGLICFTINAGIFEIHGFDQKINHLASKSSWKAIELYKADYLASKDVNAWLGLYQVV